jgi:phosphoribosyl 1,2-cyclic phosphodiesterase
MDQSIKNLRIHFYGVQGSGSIFPSKSERAELQLHSDLHLLQQVFDDLSKATACDGSMQHTLETIIGGSINRKTLSAYRDKFDLPEQRSYGGWTTCFRVETSDGYELVFDCGSGFRICAGDIVSKWGDLPERHLYIFGSHAHFDHTEGFDQAAVCFDPRNHIHVYGNNHFIRALDQNLGVFSQHVDINMLGIHTPLSYEKMPSNFDAVEIRDLEAHPAPQNDPMVKGFHDIFDPIVIGKTTIQPFEVFHPDPCIGYRIEHQGKVFVYCTDHELRRGDNPEDPLQKASIAAEERLITQAMGADILYRDGQYLRIEYDGHQGIGSPYGVSRMDWGHSCIEDVVDMAERCQIPQTYIGHHDPMRTWSERNWIDETLSRRSEQVGLKFQLAQAETVIDL